LDGGLVAQMAVRAMRVVRGIGMMPVADDAGGKYQKADQRQRNPEYANRLAHGHFGGTVTWYNPPGNSSVMWDVRKALPVTMRRVITGGVCPTALRVPATRS